MTHLMHLGLGNALFAALIAVAAAAVTWRGRCRPALAYGMWLLVLVKLVTPPLVRVPLSWSAPEPEPVAEASCPAAARRSEAEVVVADDIEATPLEGPTDWPPLLAGAWLAGSLAFAALAAWRVGRLLRWLRALSAAPPAWQGRADALAERIGLRRSPRVLVSTHGATPPLVVGLAGRAALVFPRGLWDRLGEAQRDAVLLHELAHLRRGDHRVRLLELVALALYWWFPLAWWASRRLRQAEEECCDAWVTWAAPDDRPAYAAALVETVAFLSGQSPSLPIGASGAGPVVALKRRLSMILRGKTTPGLSRPGRAMMLGALALMPLMPTLGRGGPKDGPRPAPLTGDGVLSAKSCVACHAPPPMAKAIDEDLHGRIIRLMDALKKQRDQAAKTEMELKEALAKFEKAQQKPKQEAEGRDEEVRRLREKVERLQRGLADQLEKHKDLERIRQQDRKKYLDELRRLYDQKRAKPREEEQTGTGNTPLHFTRRREIEIPYSVRMPAKSVSLFTRTGSKLEWRQIGRSGQPRGTFRFVPPKDGIYPLVVRSEGQEGNLAEIDMRPALTVIVDTVKPVIRAQLDGRKDGAAVLHWSIEEAYPDLETLRAEYRLDGEKEWRNLAITPRIDGRETCADLGKVAEVRLRIRDKAGNEGETIVKR